MRLVEFSGFDSSKACEKEYINVSYNGKKSFFEISIEKADEFESGIDFNSEEMDINIDRIDELKSPEEDESEDSIANFYACEIYHDIISFRNGKFQFR